MSSPARHLLKDCLEAFNVNTMDYKMVPEFRECLSEETRSIKTYVTLQSVSPTIYRIWARKVLNTYDEYCATLDLNTDDDYDDVTAQPVPVWVAPAQAENFNTEGSLGLMHMGNLWDDLTDEDVDACDVADCLHDMFYGFFTYSNISLPDIARYLRRNTAMKITGVNTALIEEIMNASTVSPLFPIMVVTLTIDDLLAIARTIVDNDDDDVVSEIDFVVPKGTRWGMFDPINGGGSLLNCHTTRDWCMPLFDLFGTYGNGINVDDSRYNSYGHAPSEVYGAFAPPTSLRPCVPSR